MHILIQLIAVLILLAPVETMAADNAFTLVIKDHEFTPSQLVVPANQKIKIIIDNQDPTPEEFESFALNREKVIAAKSKGIIFIGPLKAGTYTFMGEFHQKTAQGSIVVQ